MPYEAHMNLMKSSREDLLGVVNEIAQGGRWYCGVTGNKKLAKRLSVRAGDLETLSAWCWNRIAAFHSTTDAARRVYRTICEILYADLPVELRWTFDMDKPCPWRNP